MKSFNSIRRHVCVAAALVGLSGCGGGLEPESQGGSVSAQELSTWSTSLTGSCAASTARRVSASVVGAGGQLFTVAEGAVEAAGSYRLQLPSGQQRLVLLAVDAAGQVVGMALLDFSGEGSAQFAPPMNDESSLEASVFLQLVAEGVSPQAIDTVDLRARITSRIAAAVRQGASTAQELRERVRALATAVRAAQQAEVEAYTRLGVQVSQSALFQAEAQASATLNAALATGGAVEAAYERFYTELESAARRLGATLAQQLQAERAASASFRAVMQARLTAQPAQALVEAALLASAELEARATQSALRALLPVMGMADSLQAQALQAAATLRGEVRIAATAQAAAQAFARFSATLATSLNLRTTVLGSYLEVNAVTQIAASAAVNATLTASATLEVALELALSAAARVEPVDTTAAITQVVAAFQGFTTTVRAQALTLVTFGTRAAPAVELLLIAEGSFSVRN